MGRRAFQTGFVAMAAAFSIVAASCGSDDSEGSTDAPSGDGGVVLVGNALDITGALSPYALSQEAGAKLAVQQVNDAGGIDGCRVEILTEDTASDRALAPTAVLALADGGAVAVHGPSGSTSLVTAAPAAATEGIAIVAPSSVENFEEGVLNDWTFRVAPVAAFVYADVLAAMGEIYPFERLAIFYDPANNASVEAEKLLHELAPEVGFEVVAVQTAEEGATDFSSQVSNISAAKPDVIWVDHLAEESGGFIVQARERGIDAQFIGGATFSNVKIFDLAGEAGEGSLTYVPFLATSSRPETAAFVEAFEAAEGTVPDTFASQGYDAMSVILNAVKEVGCDADRTAVRDAMRTLSFEGSGGTISYEGGPDNATPGYQVVRIEGGEFVPVD